MKGCEGPRSSAILCPLSPWERRSRCDSVFLVFALLMIWLTRSRDELEVKVAERTAELTAANEKLKLEIAERKRVEVQSRTLIDAIPQQIWSGPPDGTLDYCNERLRSEKGLGLEELQGEGWQSMLHPDDVAILDISMPELDGVEVVRQIRQAVPHTKVLVLTMHESDQMVLRALDAGAHGYILKSDLTDSLLKGVSAVVGGKRFLAPKISREPGGRANNSPRA